MPSARSSDEKRFDIIGWVRGAEQRFILNQNEFLGEDKDCSQSDTNGPCRSNKCTSNG